MILESLSDEMNVDTDANVLRDEDMPAGAIAEVGPHKDAHGRDELRTGAKEAPGAPLRPRRLGVLGARRHGRPSQRSLSRMMRKTGIVPAQDMIKRVLHARRRPVIPNDVG